jgi:hypothetical protein
VNTLNLGFLGKLIQMELFLTLWDVVEPVSSSALAIDEDCWHHRVQLEFYLLLEQEPEIKMLLYY